MAADAGRGRAESVVGDGSRAAAGATNVQRGESFHTDASVASVFGSNANASRGAGIAPGEARSATATQRTETSLAGSVMRKIWRERPGVRVDFHRLEK